MKTYSDDTTHLSAFIRDIDNEISSLEKRSKDIKNAFIAKHSEYIDGDIIKIKYPAKFKDMPDYMHEMIVGIVGKPTIEINHMTEDYDICYHAKKINKNGTIKRTAEFEHKLWHTWLIGQNLIISFKLMVPRGKSLIHAAIEAHAKS